MNKFSNSNTPYIMVCALTVIVFMIVAYAFLCDRYVIKYVVSTTDIHGEVHETTKQIRVYQIFKMTAAEAVEYCILNEDDRPYFVDKIDLEMVYKNSQIHINAENYK